MQPSITAADIRQGAATVVSVSAHFTALKQRASELLLSLHATKRGFFTPTEDDQVRQLLLSYWTARNALFEQILSMHDANRAEHALRLHSLIITYSGALVLVDAARFLRDTFHDRPIVRAKLNEPEPYYGLPAGIYNRIQQSLTNPLHIWHLYHAGCAIEKQAVDVVVATEEFPELGNVVELVEQLQDRLNVSPKDYMVAGVRSQVRSFRSVIESRLIWRAMYGIQKFVSQMISGHYVRPGHQPGLPERIAAELRQSLLPGDVLVTRKEFAITNYFLPGYWPHAALHLGSVEDLRRLQVDQHANATPHWNTLMTCDPTVPNRVLEALKDGVHVRSLTCPFSSDAVAVLRPTIDSAAIAEAIVRGLFHGGKPYDFNFDFSRSDRLVCTEVIYRSYEGLGGISFALTRRAGRLNLSAEDLLQQALGRQGFEVHAVFCPAHSDSVEYSVAAEDIIRKTTSQLPRQHIPDPTILSGN